MKVAKGKILVRVDMEQKHVSNFGGKMLIVPIPFMTNHREKNPVVAYVEKGNKEIPSGSRIICHHNHFCENSPYEYGEGLFAIPCNENIFAIIDDNGDAWPVGGNVIAKRVAVASNLSIPGLKNYNDRVVITSNAYGYKEGQEVFTLPFSDYQIVYNWEGQERKIIRVFRDNIVAVLNNI